MERRQGVYLRPESPSCHEPDKSQSPRGTPGSDLHPYVTPTEVSESLLPDIRVLIFLSWSGSESLESGPGRQPVFLRFRHPFTEGPRLLVDFVTEEWSPDATRSSTVQLEPSVWLPASARMSRTRFTKPTGGTDLVKTLGVST